MIGRKLMKYSIFSVVLLIGMFAKAAWWDITPTPTDETTVPNKEWVRDYVNTNFNTKAIEDRISNLETNSASMVDYIDPLFVDGGKVGIKRQKPGWASYSGFIVNYQRDYELTGTESYVTNISPYVAEKYVRDRIVYKTVSGNAVLSDTYKLYPIPVNRLDFYDPPEEVAYDTTSTIAYLAGSHLIVRDNGLVMLETVIDGQKVITMISSYTHPIYSEYNCYVEDLTYLRRSVNDGALSALLSNATTTSLGFEDSIITNDTFNGIAINERQIITLHPVETNKFNHKSTNYYITDNIDLATWMKSAGYTKDYYKYCNGLRVLTVDKDLPGTYLEFATNRIDSITALGNPFGNKLSPVYFGKSPDTYIPDGNVTYLTQGFFVNQLDYVSYIRNDLLSYYGIDACPIHTNSKSLGRPVIARADGHNILLTMYLTPYSGIDFYALYDAIKAYANYKGFDITTFSYDDPSASEED